MKRFFTKKSVALFLLAVALCGFFYAGTVKAATPNTPVTYTNSVTNLTYTYQYNGEGDVWEDSNGNAVSGGGANVFRLDTNTANVNAAEAAVTAYDNAQKGINTSAGIAAPSISANNATTTSSSVDAFGNLANFGFGIGVLFVDGIGLAALAAILLIIYGTLSLILALVGALLDGALKMSLFGMSSFFNNLGPLNMVWTIVRDTVNIAFIFMLLYIAITMIIGSLGIKAKSNLISVIISAFFVNFSMFFAKVLIDAGNIVAVAIYNSPYIGAGNIGASIAGKLLNGFSFTANQSFLSLLSVTGQTNVLVYLVLHIAVIAIAIYVIGYAGGIFIGRLVMLIMLAVTSPIGFLGSSAIPWLDDLRGKWWKSFVEQICVAPLFMFLILLFLSLITAIQAVVQSTVGSSIWANISQGIDWASYLYYAVIIILLLEGMKMVKEMSGKAGSIANAAGLALPIAAGAILTGGASLTGAVTGAFGKEAAGAAAGKTGFEAVRARLAFGAENSNLTKFGAGAWKYANGENAKQPGLKGFLSKQGREAGFDAIKTGTGGLVNPKSIEKYYTTTQKENEKALQGQLTPDAKKLAEHEKIASDLKAQEETIEKAARGKLADEKNSDAPINAAQKDTEREHDINKNKLAKAEENTRKVTLGGNADEMREAANQFRSAQNAFTESSKRVEDFKKNDTQRLETLKDEMAKAAGTTMGEIASKKTGNERDMANVMNKVETHLEKLTKSGTVMGAWNYGLLTSKEKVKMAKNLREFVNKGGKDSEAEQMKKIFEGVLKEQKPPTSPKP